MKVAHAAAVLGVVLALSAGIGLAPASAQELSVDDGNASREEASAGVTGDVISEPAPITFGVPVDQNLGVLTGYTVSETKGLPEGLTIRADGRLTGKVPLGKTGGEFPVTVTLAAGETKMTGTITVRVVGETIEHVTRTWELGNRFSPGWGADLGTFFCPADHPWTINREFHDQFSPQRVPRGVQAVTHGGIVEVSSQSLWQDDVSRGIANVRAYSNLWWGNAAMHLRLHCTNDISQAWRR